MSWLDDIANSVRNTAGKAVYYGQQNNLPELKISEGLSWLANKIAPKASAMEFTVPPEATKLPGQIFPVINPTYGPNPDERITTPTPTGGDGGGNPNPNPNPGGTGIDLDAVMRARRARNEGSINSFLDNARGLRDEVFGLTQKKRGQYEDLYKQGDQDITQTFEGEKGNARRTFQDLVSTEGNRARALGLGGSATDYAASRRSEALGRQLGDVNTNASNNRMENKRTRDARFDQADAWDRQASNDYNTAVGRAQDARNSLLDTEENTVLGWLGNILQNQLSLNAMKSGINSETVNPYAVDTSKLTNFLNPTLTGAGATGAGQTEDGVNINDPRAIALMRNPKYSYSGLYGRLG